MTPDEVPDNIKQRVAALRGRVNQRLERSTQPPEVAKGELVGVSSPDGCRRTVLIADVDSGSGIAQVYLVTNEVGLGTHLDLLISPDDSGYAVPLIAQAELYGPVFREWLSRRAGQIDAYLVDALTQSLFSDGESLLMFDAEHGLSAGSRLTPLDHRRALKESELRDLERLTGPCWEFLLADSFPSGVIDPRALCPPPPGTPQSQALVQFSDLLDSLLAFQAEGSSLDAAVSLLEPEEFDDLDRWWTEFRCDIWRLGLDRFASAGVDRLAQSPTPSRARSDDDARLGRLAGPLAQNGVTQFQVLTREADEVPLTGMLVFDGPNQAGHVIRYKRKRLQEFRV